MNRWPQTQVRRNLLQDLHDYNGRRLRFGDILNVFSVTAEDCSGKIELCVVNNMEVHVDFASRFRGFMETVTSASWQTL